MWKSPLEALISTNIIRYNFSVTAQELHLGGVVGAGSGGIIGGGTTEGSITARSTGASDVSAVGGVAGSIVDGDISRIAAHGNFSVTSSYMADVGGIAGKLRSTRLENSFASVTMSVRRPP